MVTDSAVETSTIPDAPERRRRRSSRRLLTFVVCLGISVLMWLFIELMKDYPDELKYQVAFINSPENLILTNSGDSLLRIGMNAQGFELLAAQYAMKRQHLTIDLSSLRIRQDASGYTAYLPTAQIVEQLGPQIRFQKEITYIKPDTLFFRFSEIVKKQVRIIPDISYSMKNQYDLTDSIQFSPRFVTVSSIQSIIDTLSFIKTANIRLSGLDSSISVRVPLSKGRNTRLLRFSNDSVTISVKVEKVTEASYKVPVTVNGNGQNIKIFPDHAEILCRVPLSVYAQISDQDFATGVEYIPGVSKGSKLPVRLLRFPEKVRVLKTVPAEVEYIIIAR
jgi:hypothetical protein